MHSDEDKILESSKIQQELNRVFQFLIEGQFVSASVYYFKEKILKYKLVKYYKFSNRLNSLYLNKIKC